MKNVTIETHNGITTIEFYHPLSNSLPGKVLEELAHEIHFAGNQQETNHLLHFYVIFVVGSSTTIRQTSFNFVKG